MVTLVTNAVLPVLFNGIQQAMLAYPEGILARLVLRPSLDTVFVSDWEGTMVVLVAEPEVDDMLSFGEIWFRVIDYEGEVKRWRTAEAAEFGLVEVMRLIVESVEPPTPPAP